MLTVQSSKITFRPKVLAKVWRNDRGFVGSSIAISTFLRPLCLQKRVINFKPRLRKAVVFAQVLRIPSNGEAPESSWSSIAYGPPCVQEIGGEKRVHYIRDKAPCKNCQNTFKEVMGSMSGTNLESAGDKSFLGACAEYCPVNELIPANSVGRDTDPEMHSKLDRHRERCSSLFKGIRKLCKLANELDAEDLPDAEYKKRLEYAAKPLVNALNIFGLRPECKM